MVAPIKEYENVEVKKPWGFEYLMYGNDDVALWYLHLNSGEATSLHCHPRKKTGLVLLSGEAEISFLNDSTRLQAPSRMMIRPGLFHSTQALSDEGIALLEIETPRLKGDLVRLEDSYGRKAQPYEGGPNIAPLNRDRLVLENPENEIETNYELHECSLNLHRVLDARSIQPRRDDDIMMILEGGLYSSDQDPILVAGDVVKPVTWKRLVNNFSAPKGITILTINKL